VMYKIAEEIAKSRNALEAVMDLDESLCGLDAMDAVGEAVKKVAIGLIDPQPETSCCSVRYEDIALAHAAGYSVSFFGFDFYPFAPSARVSDELQRMTRQVDEAMRLRQRYAARVDVLERNLDEKEARFKDYVNQASQDRRAREDAEGVVRVAKSEISQLRRDRDEARTERERLRRLLAIDRGVEIVNLKDDKAALQRELANSLGGYRFYAPPYTGPVVPDLSFLGRAQRVAGTRPVVKFIFGPWKNSTHFGEDRACREVSVVVLEKSFTSCREATLPVGTLTVKI